MTLTNKLMMLDNDNTSSGGNNKKQPYGPLLVGKTVLTTYGKGIVLECRQEDTYV
jgi:hypothetical protein